MLRNQNIISFQFDSHQSFVHLYFHYFVEFFSTPIPAHGQSQLMIGSTPYFYGGFCCCCSFQQHNSICKHFTATKIFCTKGEQQNPSMTFDKSVKRTAPSKQPKKNVTLTTRHSIVHPSLLRHQDYLGYHQSPQALKCFTLNFHSPLAASKETNSTPCSSAFFTSISLYLSTLAPSQYYSPVFLFTHLMFSRVTSAALFSPSPTGGFLLSALYTITSRLLNSTIDSVKFFLFKSYWNCVQLIN